MRLRYWFRGELLRVRDLLVAALLLIIMFVVLAWLMGAAQRYVNGF